MIVRATPFIFVFALAACVPAPPSEPAEPSAAAIVGGTTDTGDTSVVAFYAQTSQSGALCTASVIAPTVLLTAAHCVLPSEVGAGATFTALPSDNVNTSTGVQWPVKETHYDSSFDINDLDNGHDIAVALLEQPVTLTPLTLNTSDPSSLVGKSVRLVGYGVNNGSAQTGAGIKRTVSVPVDSVDAKLIQIGGDGKDTCQGDSGGPAIATIDGQNVIVGITSFGESGCGGGGYDTRVDLYTSFLAPYLHPGSTGGPSKNASEKEPNNDSDQANQLADGAIEGTLSPTGDVDWFAFTVPGPSSYTLTLVSSRTSATFHVYKMAASGSLSSIGAADKDTLTKASASGGIYYVKVYDDGAAHIDKGSYTLTLR